MQREVFGERLIQLYDSVQFVQRNYALEKSQRSVLAKAAAVLFALAQAPSIAPIDPDKSWPLLKADNGRRDEDNRDIQDASRMLLGDMRTAMLGERLRRLDAYEADGSVQGWRWLRAAHVLLGPRVREDLRGSWGYFAGIARGFREADRDRPLRASELMEPSVDEIRRLLAS